MECMRGDFVGEMKSSKDLPLTCRKCKQPNCQGRRVEFAAGKQATEGANGKKGGGAKKSASPAKKSVAGSSSGATAAKKSKKKKK